MIVAPCGFDLAASREALAALDGVPEWTALRAYRTDRVFAVDGNAYVNRPGPAFDRYCRNLRRSAGLQPHSRLVREGQPHNEQHPNFRRDDQRTVDVAG